MSRKQSSFNEIESVPDSYDFEVFGNGVNRRISKENLFSQIKDESFAPFIYPSVALLQAADLEADFDNPTYVRVEENQYKLYKITNLYPSADDIALNNGNTATFQVEYRDIGFVVGPASSTPGAIAIYSDSSGAMLGDGPVISEIGQALVSAPSLSEESFIKVGPDDSVQFRTKSQLKTDLSLPENTVNSIAGKVSGPDSSADDQVALFDGITGKLLKAGQTLTQIFNGWLVQLYNYFPRNVNTFVDLASTPTIGAGQIVQTKGHTISGIGSLKFISKSGGPVTSNGGTLINSATAGFYWEAFEYDHLTPFNFGARADNSTDDSAAINAAIQASEGIVRCRGIYSIASTILINKSGVILEGDGIDTSHDSGTGTYPITAFVWRGAVNGVMVNCTTPPSPSSSKINGCGLINIQLDGFNNAATGLRVASVVLGQFKNLYVHNCRSQSYFITCLIQGVSISEASDTQGCVFENCSWRNSDSALVQNAHGITFGDGDELGTTTGNTSFNRFINCGGRTTNGHGFNLYAADNNTFIQCSASTFGTGFPAYFRGDRAYSNFFYGWSANNPMRFAGVASGLSGNSYKNVIMNVDTANSTPDPVADAGAQYTYSNDYGLQYHLKSLRAYFSETFAGVATNTNTAAVNIHSGSSNHISLFDGSNLFGISINAPTGDFRILRFAGSGLINLGNGIDLGVLGRRWTTGNAAPTTGTWARGDRCINNQPAVGLPKAWTCTVAGTPGTWVSEGNL